MCLCQEFLGCAHANRRRSERLPRPWRSLCAAVVLYFGTRPHTFACPRCKAVYAAGGAKWRLAYRFTLSEEWPQYRQRYKAIMLPDDDLTASSSAHRIGPTARCCSFDRPANLARWQRRVRGRHALLAACLVLFDQPTGSTAFPAGRTSTPAPSTLCSA